MSLLHHALVDLGVHSIVEHLFSLLGHFLFADGDYPGQQDCECFSDDCDDEEYEEVRPVFLIHDCSPNALDDEKDQPHDGQQHLHA